MGSEMSHSNVFWFETIILRNLDVDLATSSQQATRGFVSLIFSYYVRLYENTTIHIATSYNVT